MAGTAGPRRRSLGGPLGAGAQQKPPWRSPGEGSPNIGLGRALGPLGPAPAALPCCCQCRPPSAPASSGLSGISHGAWMATTVLRVMRPEASATLARRRPADRRYFGGSADRCRAPRHRASRAYGGDRAGGLRVGNAAVVGPAHYGFYTFFLTLLALELVSVGQAASWHLALVRVVLTLAGAAVAVAERLSLRSSVAISGPRRGVKHEHGRPWLLPLITGRVRHARLRRRPRREGRRPGGRGRDDYGKRW